MTTTPHFHVRIAPQQSLLHVEIRVAVQDGDTFFLPVWIPGSYLIREFERGLQDLHIDAPSEARVFLERTDKTTWQIHADAPTDITLRYSIYGRELTVRTAHIDPSHAFFNGANALVCFPHLKDRPHRVSIEAPDGWTSFVSLPEEQGDFIADSYVHLADTAFEIGPHPHHDFHVDGVPHRMIFWGIDGLPSQLPALEKDTADIIRQNRETFGRPLPYARYDFIFHITPTARGGLEHRDSTTLATPWHYFESDAGYVDMLTLIAHEHFHAYNGRRLAPASLEHIDFTKENYTQELWAIEGFTSYFDELNTYLANKMTRAQWLERLGKAFTQLFRTHGRTRQPLTEASFDAWIRLYRPYEHTRNQTVSYYLKGSLVALAVDLRMQQVSQGRAGLKNVMQEMWARWEDHDEHYTLESVLDIVRSLTDERVAEEMKTWLTTTDAPPYQELLEGAGVVWQEVTSDPVDVGIQLRLDADSAIVVSRDEGRGDALAELLPGDEIVAVDGRRVRSAEIAARLQTIVGPEPTEHTLTIFRLGTQRSVRITLWAGTEIQLREVEGASPSTPNAPPS